MEEIKVGLWHTILWNTP